jgi:hypothetical protein
MELKTDPVTNKTQVVVKGFSKLPITTMTGGCDFSTGTVNTDVLFYALPCTPLQPSDIATSGRKIPFLKDKPGAILGLRYQSKSRGLAHKKSSSAFQHSVTIDMCSNDKSVNMKLAKNSIHICGAKTPQGATEAFQLLIQNLLRVQKNFNYARSNPREAEIIAAFIAHHTIGLPIICSVQLGNSGKIQLVERKTDNTVILPADPQKLWHDQYIKFRTDYLKKPRLVVYDSGTTDAEPATGSAAGSPSDPAFDFYTYLLSFAHEYKHHTSYRKMMQWVYFNIPKHYADNPDEVMCCDMKLEITPLRVFMVNYNFRFEFDVNREKLAEIFNNYDHFNADFDKAVKHQVTVTLPLDQKELTLVKRKKGKKEPQRSWLVQKCGSITMSSPILDGTREAYYKFMKRIADKLPLIIVEKLPNAIKK